MPTAEARHRRAGRTAAALLATGLLAASATACSSTPAAPNAADRTFLQDMIPHHERAIAVARIGLARADDPRVRAFARRIVREQTPELHAMQSQARGEHLDLAAGARMAVHRITDAQVDSLEMLHGRAFDRRFLALHITSEQGAAAMARTEVADGRDDDSLEIARGIASAPSNEIPELRKLRASLS